MAKLKKITITHHDAAADRYVHENFDVYVNTGGRFYATLPNDEWVESAETTLKSDPLLKRGDVREGKGKHVLYSNSLDELEKILRESFVLILDATSTSETVIRFGYLTDYNLCEVGGNLVPNGSTASGGNYLWHQGSHDRSPNSFRFGLSAAVFNKVTTTRGDKSHTKYEPARDHKLNDFKVERDALNPGAWRSGLQIHEIPYSVDAENYFYDALMQIALLAHRLKQFLGDLDQVQKVIGEHGSGHRLLSQLSS